MPGRVAARSARQSAAVKSSTQAHDAHPPPAASSSSMIDPPLGDDGPPSKLRAKICGIFADAQRTAASHRKLVINLRRIQEGCCFGPGKTKGNEPTEEAVDEDGFNAEIERCILKLMGAKKGETVADRVVKFLGLFLKHASDKDNTEAPADDPDMLVDTPSTRLISRILSVLLPLLPAKEKTVRYRATQLVSHIINAVDSIDDDLFQSLKLGLLRRLKDKEGVVRVQAVLGLGRLAGNEAEEDETEGENEDEDVGGLLERLLRVLQNDPSAEVRRSLLLNLPLTPTTLPFLLERARDQDAPTRRVLYSRLLPAIGDFRHLSLSMREKLLRWGFRDRDESVRKAAGKLFRERWIEDCAGTAADGERAAGEASPPNFDALLEMLERIDVVNSGVEDGVALEAMKTFWDGRPDYREAASFEDSFWDSLSAESAFMARTFNDFCRIHGSHESLMEKMPEVTKLAFYLQRYTNKLVETIKTVAADGRDPEADDETIEQGFIVEQLLHIAQVLDYSDEVGRRKMFSLMREILATPELPEEATKLVVEVLRTVCGQDAASEREFCSVVLEAVSEVHDTIGTTEDGGASQHDESFHSARSEISDASSATVRSSDISTARLSSSKGAGQADDNDDDEERLMREIIVNMKCLHIAQCMLQNVEGPLQENGHLVSMLNNLVVPAVRSPEAPLRERGLVCLGLCCLLDKTLAEENLTLFLHCFNKGHDALQVSALHILCDILTTHGSGMLNDSAGPEQRKALIKVFTKGLKASSSSSDKATEVQSAACTAICKLMLGGILTDDDLLRQLVVAYFDPDTAHNLALRQALTYFLPVYCHSCREHQQRMQRIAVATLHSLMLLHEKLDDDDDGDEEMVGLTVIGAHLVDWTDPRKLVVMDDESSQHHHQPANKRKEVTTKFVVNGDIHLLLARDILESICSPTCQREEKKLLTTMLNKLHLPPPHLIITSTSNGSSSSNSNITTLLRDVHHLAHRAIDEKLLPDAPSRNVLTKLATGLDKMMEDVIADDDDGGDEVGHEKDEDEGDDGDGTTTTTTTRDGAKPPPSSSSSSPSSTRESPPAAHEPDPDHHQHQEEEEAYDTTTTTTTTTTTLDLEHSSTFTSTSPAAAAAAAATTTTTQTTPPSARYNTHNIDDDGDSNLVDELLDDDDDVDDVDDVDEEEGL